MTETSHPPSRSPRSPGPSLDLGAIAALLFFASGAAALLYQTAFVRSFVDLYGSTAAALGAVVGGFLLCLAVGAFACARPADRSRRPLRLYALLEAVAALGGLVSVGILGALDSVADRLASQAVQGAGGGLLRWGAALAVMGLPMTALGGTLPVLARYRNLERRRGAAAGGLQVASTLGAVAGALGASLLLVPGLGLAATVRTAALINAAVAVTAFVLDRRRASAPVLEAGATAATASAAGDAAPGGENAESVPPLPYLLASLLAGISVVGLEVILFRGLSQIHRGGLDSVGVLLATFLAANALGTALGVILARSSARARSGFAWGQVLTVLGTLWGLAALYQMAAARPDSLWMVGQRAETFSGRLALEALTTVAIAGPVGFAAGIAFPCVCQLRPRGLRGFGTWVALLSGCWTIGAAVAGLLAPAVVLPAWGLRGGLLALAALPAVALTVVLWTDGRSFSSSRPAVAGGALLAALLLFVPLSGPSAVRGPLQFYAAGLEDSVRLLAYGEDEIANVAVVEMRGGQKLLKVNNHFSLGGSGASKVEGLQALLPAVLAGEPKKALVLGVGAGITVGALRQYGVFQIDAVELLPKVMEFLPHFRRENGDITGDQGVRLIEGDARSFVRAAADNSYDLIVGDLFFPWQSEAGFLYTREHFERVARLLKPGGLFCQWLPGHQLRWEELGIIGRTFSEVFESTTVWLASWDFPYPILGLVGSNTRMALNVDEIRQRVQNPLRAHVWETHGYADYRRLLALYVGDDFFFRDNFEGESVNTADLPRVEFLAARRMVSDGVQSIHNRENLFELHEDVAGRMSIAGLEPKERVLLQRDLESHSRLVWELFKVDTLRLLADANRSLGPAQRLNDPEGLELEAFQRLGGVLLRHPQETLVMDQMVDLLSARIRLGHHASVVEAVSSVLEGEQVEQRARLRNLRGMALFHAHSNPQSRAQFNNPLRLAVTDFEAALAEQPDLIEAQVNLGVALFLLGRDDEAREQLSAARAQIKAPHLPGGRGLPRIPESILLFLSGNPQQARQLLKGAPSSIAYLPQVWERFEG